MKITTLKFFISMLSIVLFISCSDEKDVKLVPKEEGLNVSDISLIEQSLGSPLFKTDKVFTDKFGNSLTIRFASLNKGLLEDYIRATNYSVTFYKVAEAPQGLVKAVMPDKETPTLPDVEVGYDQKVVIETISKSLMTGTGGYTVHVKSSDSFANGRIQRDGWWVEHTSDAWPEELYVTNFTADYIHYKLYRKWNWSDVTWGSYFYIKTFYGTSDLVNVDGPWKVRLNLEYDHSTGSYDYSWYDVETNTWYH